MGLGNKHPKQKHFQEILRDIFFFLFYQGNAITFVVYTVKQHSAQPLGLIECIFSMTVLFLIICVINSADYLWNLYLLKRVTISLSWNARLQQKQLWELIHSRIFSIDFTQELLINFTLSHWACWMCIWLAASQAGLNIL